jgi:hypothetical protein
VAGAPATASERLGSNVHFDAIRCRCRRLLVSSVTIVATRLRARRPMRFAPDLWQDTAARALVSRRRTYLSTPIERVVCP